MPEIYTNEYNDECNDVYNESYDEEYKDVDIDLCSCYFFDPKPPDEQLEEWRRIREENVKDVEPALENTSCYVDVDENHYFCCKGGIIKITEHFPDSGKPMGTLLEDVIHYAANNKKTEPDSASNSAN